jgi:hypothetical protein
MHGTKFRLEGQPLCRVSDAVRKSEMAGIDRFAVGSERSLTRRWQGGDDHHRRVCNLVHCAYSRAVHRTSIKVAVNCPPRRCQPDAWSDPAKSCAVCRKRLAWVCATVGSGASSGSAPRVSAAVDAPNQNDRHKGSDQASHRNEENEIQLDHLALSTRP